MYTMADIRTWTVKRRDGDYDIVLTLGNRRWRIAREGSRWRFGNSLYPNLRIVKQLIVDAANLNRSSDDRAEAAERESMYRSLCFADRQSRAPVR